jgi:parvulin-like peptidyl-prolyl isomerase
MNTKSFKSLLAGAILTGCLASTGAKGQPASGAQIDLSSLFKDNVVAKGKGFEISQSELDKAVITTKANRVSQGNPIPPALNDEVEAQILDKLITTKILLLKATTEQRRKGEANAAQFIQDIIRQHPSEEVFKRQLLTTGMDLDYFTAQIKEQAIVKEVIDTDLKAGYIVPDEKARSFYQENKERFAIPERARLQNIFIPILSIPEGTPLPLEEQTKRLTKAKEAQKKAASGEDFATLVKTYSLDALTKQQNGEVTIARDTNDPTLEGTIFKMKAGQVSDVIKTHTGYHIVKILEITPREYQTFEEVSEPIKAQLEAEYVQKLLPDYLSKLKKEAEVEITLD